MLKKNLSFIIENLFYRNLGVSYDWPFVNGLYMICQSTRKSDWSRPMTLRPTVCTVLAGYNRLMLETR